jgi:hypothetical protein
MGIGSIQLGHDPGLYHWPVKDCEVVLFTECFDPTTTKRAVDVWESARFTSILGLSNLSRHWLRVFPALKYCPRPTQRH